MYHSFAFSALRHASVSGLAALSLFVCSPVWAQSIVAPNANATTEGNARLNTAPFNTTSTSRYQNIYGTSQFSSLTEPAYITQIAFRPDATQGSAFSNTFANVQIDLSTTSQSVAGLSATFANNVGANDQIVYNGALTLSSANQSVGATKAFDIVIDLQTPFLYDPTAGNLLIDIRTFTGGLTGFFDAQQDLSSTAQRLVFAQSPNASSGVNSATGTVQSFGLVTRFTFTSVPEPGTLALLGLALPTIGFARRRKV